MERKNSKGITLIALVITIIILLILAGVVLNLTIGERGIFNIAQQAGKEYKQAEVNEQKSLDDLYSQMLIATNDSSKITISVEDLKNLIKTQVQEEIGSQENKKVLWENPNKTASFDERVISWAGETPSEGTKPGAEIYEYDYLLIEYTDPFNKCEIVAKGKDAILTSLDEDNNGVHYYIRQRCVTAINDTSLKFDNVKVIQLSASGGYHKYSNWNTNCIPIKIIGIKE